MKLRSIFQNALTTVGIVMTLYFVFLGTATVWKWMNPIDVSSTKMVHFRKNNNEKAPGVVIFVHGFGGNVEDTWKNKENNTSWPELIKSDPKFDNFDVQGYSYQTAATGDASNLTIIVGNLEKHLTEAYKNYYRVVVIAHSMGGIFSALAIQSSFPKKDDGTVVNLITLATPFDGSKLANYLETSIGMLRSEHVDVLTTNSPFRELFFSSTWPRFRREHREDFRHYIAYEGKSLSGNPLNLKVVDINSSVFGVSEGDPVKIRKFDDLDHWTIAAPTSLKGDLHTQLKQWVFEGERIVVPRLPKTAAETGFKTFLLPAGTHVVDQDIELPASCVLKVEPGVTLRFDPGVKAIIEGVVIAKGEKEHQIIFDFNKENNEASGLYLSGKGISGSRFMNCVFRYGNGLEFQRVLPKSPQWRDAIGLDERRKKQPNKTKRHGGAVLIKHGQNVWFNNCLFKDNCAWLGGAVALFGSSGIEFQKSLFVRNRSGYGGAAIFTQHTQVDFESTNFHQNMTDHLYIEPELSDLDLRQYACGGAIYIGYASTLFATNCLFEQNKANYVGGAIYADNTCPTSKSESRESLLANCQFNSNNAGGIAGAAIWLDNATRVNLTMNTFDGNFSGNSKSPGQAVKDKTNINEKSGLKLNGSQVLIGYDMPPDDDLSPAQYAISTPIQSFAIELLPTSPKKKQMPTIFRSLMKNPKSFESRQKQPLREIDTIILHHVSAIFWNDPKFQSTNSKKIRKFEQMLKNGPITNHEKRKFDWRYCKQIFEIYGVSAHYMINRDGKVIQLVQESDIAYHAGKSKMPEPDGRDSVNKFSIGIELISSHPDDDASIADGTTPAYTNAQYDAVANLLRYLVSKYEIPTKNIIGHEEISPGRKKDPGPMFDWGRIRQQLTGVK